MKGVLRAALALALLTALATPTVAAGKEIGALKVCGPDACHQVTNRSAMRAFLEGGYETLAPTRGGTFYAVTARMRHEGEDAGGYTVQYVPALNLLRAEADYGEHKWLRPAGVTARALRRAARGLRPYPADELGPTREPSPAPAESPPARVSSPARGDGSSRLGLAGGTGALVIALLATTLIIQRRRRAP
jgi:hypothetical protein